MKKEGRRPRFSLFALMAFVGFVCFLLAFPRYSLLVGLLFGSVLAVLAMLGAFMGKLPHDKRPGVAVSQHQDRE